MNRQSIVVVLAADAGFVKQLAVAVAAISARAEREHDVYVLHDGFDSSVMGRVATLAGGRVRLHWRDARSTRLRDALLPRYLPKSATLFRLRMGDLLPHDVGRAVYLDADVAIRWPLDALWETDLRGAVVGAVRDPVVPWAGAPDGLPWREIGIAPDVPYFNNGVLVVDLESWREQGVGDRALELMNLYRFRYADQCALNSVVAGDWVSLEPRWNLQAGHLRGQASYAWLVEPRPALAAAREDPAIVHYNSSPLGRPWTYGCGHPYAALWYQWLDSTPWAGWRPSRPSRAGMFARRMRRAGAVLLGR